MLEIIYNNNIFTTLEKARVVVETQPNQKAIN